MALLDPTRFLGPVPVIPILTIGRLDDAVPLARALVAGGLPMIEISLRSAMALDAIRLLADEVPEAVVGAGTVTRPQDIDDAVDAGAKFLATAGTPADLADALALSPLPALPGSNTVTEAMALVGRGFAVTRFCPAEPSGGAAWLRAAAEPLPSLWFLPVGGITPANAADYLALPNVIAVGASWLAPPELLAAGEYGRITALAHAASQLRGPLAEAG